MIVVRPQMNMNEYCMPLLNVQNNNNNNNNNNNQ